MNISDLKHDLFPFCDLATELDIIESKDSVRVKLTRNGIDHDYLIEKETGKITARHINDTNYPSLTTLLGSEHFSDIKSLVETQKRVYSEFTDKKIINPEGFIESEPLELGSLKKQVTPSKKLGDLQVALFDGPAGVGKTTLINVLLFERAEQYGHTSFTPPILHVTSRGRRLSSLNDALATSIQLIRAKFTFDQVPVLIRHNLLQVAIDGFDELVDPDGYKDAWSALRDFFLETTKGGPIILAGRDTFFDQQKFAKQLSEFGYHSKPIHVRLTPVSSTSAKDWLTSFGWSDEDINHPNTNAILYEGSYALRPYFLSVLAPLKSWENLSESNLSIRGFLVDQFLTREAELVSTKTNIDKKLIKDKLYTVFEEIALEMSDSETESVDLPFLQLVTEYAFSDLIKPDDLKALKHKAGSLALLEKDVREDHRRFPHTEISHHFLSKALINAILNQHFPRTLRRSIFASDFLATFQETFEHITTHEAFTFVQEAYKGLESVVSNDKLRENLLSLLITTLSKHIENTNRDIRDGSINEALFSGVSEQASFTDIIISRFHALGADLSQIKFNNCEINFLMADETTRFGSSIPKIHCLQFDHRGIIDPIYDPSEILSRIASTTQREDEHLSAKNQKALLLLERICRKMMRQFYIKISPDEPVGVYLQDPLWDEIRQILESEGRLRSESKAYSGPAAEYIHIINASDFLSKAPIEESTTRIINAVGRLP